jgi:hypothetical protein
MPDWIEQHGSNMRALFKSLIQSDFGSRDHGNFEALILEGDVLMHWYRDNTAGDMPWRQGKLVELEVAWPGSLIQSTFGTSEHGNFEATVPIKAVSGGVELWHYWHDNSDVGLPWQRGGLIATNVAGPASLIQSTFGPGNFEVVVPLHTAAGSVELWHFWRDNGNAANPWQQGALIATNVAGPGCLIQSDLGSSHGGNFEVVVPLHGADGLELWHFWHDNSDLGSLWQRGALIASGVAGPGALIQSDFGVGDHGNFEVVVPLSGGELWHFWHDNSDTTSPWRRGQLVTSASAGWATLMRSDYGLDESGHGNFELLAEELTRSVYSYWHPNQEVTLPWLRDWRGLIREPYPSRVLDSTRKVVQLTGEWDLEGWTPDMPKRPFAFNRTESQPAQIRGCDLGVSFPHRDLIYFLFGDTWHKHVTDENINLDSVATTRERDASAGLHLEFLVDPPIIHPAVPQREFNVPLDGTSHGDRMYVFFSTDHETIDSVALMGRSLLTWCDDEVHNRFAQIKTFSGHYFVNVSVEQGVLDEATRRQLDWPHGPEVLWVWGSGRYRASDIRLAVVALDDLDSLQDVRYYASRLDDEPRWSQQETDAVPILTNGSVGELSVRWNPQLERYLALFAADNPGGVIMHSSRKPWGPWSSQPVMVFDPWRGVEINSPGVGIGRFMHRSWEKLSRIDFVQDDITSNSGPRDDVGGACYAPYQIAPCSTGQIGNFTQLYFAMSTWNPYQSMLMTTTITVDDRLD